MIIIIIIISLVCRYQCSDLTTLDSDIRNQQMIAIPAIVVGSMSNLMSGVLPVIFPGWALCFSLYLKITSER